MEHTTYIKASYSLYNYGYGTDLPHPREIQPPSGGINISWIPQTIVDSIWIIYSFKNKNDADEFLNCEGVHATAKKCVANRALRKQWNIKGAGE